jgi:hypothetical protein
VLPEVRPSRTAESSFLLAASAPKACGATAAHLEFVSTAEQAYNIFVCVVFPKQAWVQSKLVAARQCVQERERDSHGRVFCADGWDVNSLGESEPV